MEKKLTVDELMMIAKRPLKKAKDIIGDYNDVQKFSLMNEIKTDRTNAVPTYIIFELYAKWCLSNDLVIMQRGVFFKEFSKMFEKVKKSGDIHYHVNGVGMDLTSYSSSEKEIMKKTYSRRISLNAEKKVHRERSKTKL